MFKKCIFILLYTGVQFLATADECFYSFCNKTQDYPYEKIQALLNQNDKYSSYFDTTFGKEKENYVRIRKDVLNSCAVARIGLYPKQARNIKGKISTIVNTEEYRQYVRYERCLEPHCKPTVKVVELAAFDNVTNSIYLDKFLLPMTCQVEEET